MFESRPISDNIDAVIWLKNAQITSTLFLTLIARLGIDLFPAPLAAKICCYGGQAIRLRLVKSIAFMVRWLENCSRKINLRYLLGISIVHID